MASQGWIFLNDATNLTSLLGGLGGIIAASQILKQSLGTSSRLQTAAELLKQCQTYTSHIEKMIEENGEELWSHVAFVSSMKGNLERYDHCSPLSAYSRQRLAGWRGIFWVLKGNSTLVINGERS
jgi:hypothetical protein